MSASARATTQTAEAMVRNLAIAECSGCRTDGELRVMRKGGRPPEPMEGFGGMAAATKSPLRC
jgi:hypothetical protein